MRKHICLLLLGWICALAGCSLKNGVNITPHEINGEADLFYREALRLSANYDVDTTLKSIQLLDSALSIDSLNPDYYGLKAKLLCELGYLDSALLVQERADRIGAVTGEYLFQLGLFQAAKGDSVNARESFRRSNRYQMAILKHYPDSLGALIIQQAANAAYHGTDSLYMADLEQIKKRFPDRLMEIEISRRVKPSSLIRQIRLLELAPEPE
ncbi:hypothetical protein [Petrimonas mucosa]|jgi:hypothetical protein|uniref:hypothetical protein n=1 Tax=Petrimonas mucosa TaxID=1642646 RepID=UPI0008DFA328|nr:hypothetical protein [Petrimonas mucosa]MDD3561823.1 hypothetical protein [Petrimonas mucosa]SFU27452.1 hypothetical protein SAMN05216364_1001154 [Porphyromonadaceae bacterium KHP3R9]